MSVKRRITGNRTLETMESESSSVCFRRYRRAELALDAVCNSSGWIRTTDLTIMSRAL